MEVSVLFRLLGINTNVSDDLHNHIVELYNDFIDYCEHSIFWNGNDNTCTSMLSSNCVSISSNGTNKTYKILTI